MILKIVIAVGFLLAGTAKLASAKPIVAQFEEFGLSNNIMRGIGILEIAGAISLFVPQLSFPATLALALLMIGAIFNHYKVKHPPKQSAPAATLLLLCIIVMIQV